MSVQEVRYYIDQLKGLEYVDSYLVVGEPARYYLDKAGRAALFKRNLL